jgi:hypothetical protein
VGEGGGDGSSRFHALDHQASWLLGIKCPAIKHTVDADGLVNEIREVGGIPVELDDGDASSTVDIKPI